MESIANGDYREPGAEDKLIDGSLKDKDLVEDDLNFYLKFILYSTVEDDTRITTNDVIRAFNLSARVVRFSKIYTKAEGQHYYKEVMGRPKEQKLFAWIWDKKLLN